MKSWNIATIILIVGGFALLIGTGFPSNWQEFFGYFMVLMGFYTWGLFKRSP